MERFEAVKVIYENSPSKVALADDNFSVIWKNFSEPAVIRKTDIEELENGRIKLPLTRPAAAKCGEYTVRIEPVMENSRTLGYILYFNSPQDVRDMWVRSGMRVQHNNFCGNIRAELGQINALVKDIGDPDMTNSPEKIDELRNNMYFRVTRVLAATVNFNELVKYDFQGVDRILDISERLEKLADDFKTALGEQTELITDIKSGVKLRYCDEKMRPAVANLLVNGVMYNSKEHKTLKLTLEENEDMVIITVSDNGDGMDEELLNRYKQPFGMVKNYNTKEGLGIALASAFSEYHGGRLELSSKINEGTTAVIYLSKTDEHESNMLYDGFLLDIPNPFGSAECVFSKAK